MKKGGLKNVTQGTYIILSVINVLQIRLVFYVALKTRGSEKGKAFVSTGLRTRLWTNLRVLTSRRHQHYGLESTYSSLFML